MVAEKEHDGQEGRSWPESKPNRNSQTDSEESLKKRPVKWSLGILNDKETDEVPGSVLLLSKVSNRNEPLGLRNTPARTSTSSLPSPFPYSQSHNGSLAPRSRAGSIVPPTPDKKQTGDGIVLEPQPDESLNDPLNWPKWRRDCALLSLGFFCMLGGGMTPVLAAGFVSVSETYHVSVPQVALTTGLYMLGLGLGSVVASPTAILYGKRPVYLVASVIFVLSAVWCALSPNYASLVLARIFMGFAVSPVECLPSATIAEIFFLHERAYRLGIYTLLLLGGKNLIPLVSAAIIQSLGWRWVFWIVAIVVSFGAILLFLFVPETFWDRTPRPSRHSHKHRPRLMSNISLASIFHRGHADTHAHEAAPELEKGEKTDLTPSVSPTKTKGEKRLSRHAHFSEPDDDEIAPADVEKPSVPALNLPSPEHSHMRSHSAQFDSVPPSPGFSVDAGNGYTSFYRAAPPKSFKQTLKPYAGRLSQDRWFKVALRPFILFAYPAILWSSLVYALSVGWLIVLSESVSVIYENRATYHFTSLQVGLVYISPFIGGILGTAVAGRFSDVIVRWMSRKNDGVYEPEFRLLMAIPVTISTVIGLMGYGWSVSERDAWIVPTVFFGIISFGCCVGSTTAITFAVDSYRQYAGEALVTLNFSKNIFHGLVFSLFFNHWLQSDGPKRVFLALGGIQLGCLIFTIPMYIYGKRARMWTVRKNLMEKF
ncbi:MFS general substrate transporter [Aureobasidium melanogenum CBS 110374]|uniref:MFS general substrate transporter n=1 Tax=Aureobasidium melanogenum (strain CBS 110374) TaxID=1043003 RepID=A0A074W543_AURM1|nr:MFS general substrate transporter [Aureobasidium melanogenum CBS 110374]KEQ66664.1 MFS general substrate transporter [Aureobasidium melanogenum CBS 110374]